MNSRHRFRLSRCVAACTLLAGCAVGPDYKAPAPPTSPGYLRPDTASVAAGPVIQVGVAVSARWWTSFGSTKLDGMVEEALKNNASMAAAQAALREAEENAAAQRGYFLPSLAANYSPSRQRNPVGTLAPTLASGSPVFNLYTAQLTIGYVPDVFGGNRRALESLEASADVQRYNAEATAVTLAATVVVTAIQEAALNDQIHDTEALIEAESKTLALVRRQFDAGYAAGTDVATQEVALAQARATLPALRRAHEQTLDLEAALLGSSPDRADLPSLSLADFHLPAELPLTLPAQLVAQRPDVKAAEAQLHAASAQIGVAVAARYPQFAVSGAYGGTSTQMSQLFSSGNIFWSLVGSASQSIFDGGTLAHHESAARAAFDATAAQYQSTVIAALQNVADTLYALRNDSDLVDATGVAQARSARLLDLDRHQLDAGYVNVLAVLAAEQSFQQSDLALLQARASQLMDAAALFQALGGGWGSGTSNPPAGPASGPTS